MNGAASTPVKQGKRHWENKKINKKIKKCEGNSAMELLVWTCGGFSVTHFI